MDEINVFTCGYCKLIASWENILMHPCLGGESALCLNDNNEVYRENDTNPSTSQEFQVREVLENEKTDCETAEEGRTEWQHEAVLLLIDEFRKNKDELNKKNSMKKHIWQKKSGDKVKKLLTYISTIFLSHEDRRRSKIISMNVQVHSYSYTWDQLQNKWKSLLRTFKSIKDHNNQTGRNRKHWPYFDAINEIMSANPAIEPPLLLNSGEVENETRSTSTTPHSTRSSTPDIQIRKRKSSTEINELLQTALQQNQIQHNEEMQERRRFNDLLEKLINNMNHQN